MTSTVLVYRRQAQYSDIVKGHSDNMVRTLITLDEGEYKLAKKEAKALGISVAEFVRRAIRERLPITTDKPWMQYAGIIESGDPLSSQTIDDVVYGRKD